MKFLILGGDGYTGWPLAMHMAKKGHEVTISDNYQKRTMSKDMGRSSLIDTPDMAERTRTFRAITGIDINYSMGDCSSYAYLEGLIGKVKPDAIVHYAEIPSAPYSMIGYGQALHTLDNNLHSTLALIHSVIKHCPDAHIIKAGTTGEYGTPNVPIKEGWLEVEDNGRTHTFRYPSIPGSMYHVTKVQDTEMLWLYAKTNGLRVTDIMQGPVYGLNTPETEISSKLATNFHYDDVFGTVLNRFVVQALAGVPLTVYGLGGQKRGFINLRDVMKCLEIVADNPADRGELRIINQVVSFHTVNELAAIVKCVGDEMGLNVNIQHIENPRIEEDDHFYEMEHKWLPDHGLVSRGVDKEFIREFINSVKPHIDNINTDHILPEYGWKSS